MKAPSHQASLQFVAVSLSGLVRAVGRLVGFSVYAVLATLEPVVRALLLLLALAGFVTCVIYGLLLRDPHFPMKLLLLFSVAMCVLSAAYSLLVRSLFRG